MFEILLHAENKGLHICHICSYITQEYMTKIFVAYIIFQERNNVHTELVLVKNSGLTFHESAANSVVKKYFLLVNLDISP